MFTHKLAAAAGGLAAVASLVSLPAGPASASEPGRPDRVEATTTGAWGYLGNIQYNSWTTVYMHFYLRDTSADGEHAQARVQSLDGAGSLHLYKWHSAVGYGTAYSENVHVTDTRRVAAVRIQVCRMGDELPTLCDWSRWSENPYQ